MCRNILLAVSRQQQYRLWRTYYDNILMFLPPFLSMQGAPVHRRPGGGQLWQPRLGDREGIKLKEWHSNHHRNAVLKNMSPSCRMAPNFTKNTFSRLTTTPLWSPNIGTGIQTLCHFELNVTYYTYCMHSYSNVPLNSMPFRTETKILTY